MPRYDPSLGREVPTEEERFLSGELDDVRLELRLIRAELRDIREAKGELNTWLLRITQTLDSLQRFLVPLFIFLLAILSTLIAIANKLAPGWWHTPWWGQ